VGALVTASVLLLAALGPAAPSARGDELTVPVELQVDLVGRIARYERNFAAHASEPASIVVVARSRSPESQRVAAQLVASLSRTAQIGGRPVRVSRHEYTSAAALGAELDRAQAAIVYTAPGLSGDMSAIAEALSGRSILSISAVGADVDHGVVLGFELVASRPQIAIHLGRARAQRLQFSAQLLRLARVVQ
jgi:hypothetical protein